MHVCMSFLLPIAANAWPKDMIVDYIVKGGADKFYDKLDEILGHEAETSDPFTWRNFIPSWCGINTPSGQQTYFADQLIEEDEI